MSLSEKLQGNRSTLTDYSAWKKKLRKQIIIFLFVILTPVVFLYGLVFKLMFSR